MKTLLFVAGVLFCMSAQAQYYYKDVVGTAETAAMLRSYKQGNVSRVVLASFDADNTRNEDLVAEQQFDAGSGTLKTTTRSGLDGSALLVAHTDATGRVVRTVDSSENSTTTTTYKYNAEGKLVNVLSISSDKAGTFSVQEEHQWQWDGGRITGMLRIRNGKDTTIITFRHDEQGNIIEEHAQRNGVKQEPVYYYYNDKSQLTDIVRFNNKAKRLLPEYMFEYNDAGQVIQRITFPANSSEYTIWRYQYNGQGLRIREAIYNKQKQLTGKVEYSYQK
jgi:YD repeat-containing protein